MKRNRKSSTNNQIALKPQPVAGVPECLVGNNTSTCPDEKEPIFKWFAWLFSYEAIVITSLIFLMTPILCFFLQPLPVLHFFHKFAGLKETFQRDLGKILLFTMGLGWFIGTIQSLSALRKYWVQDPNYSRNHLFALMFLCQTLVVIQFVRFSFC